LWFVLVGAINSALSLYYYSRVVKALWVESPAEELTIERYPTALYVAVIAAAVLTVALLPGLLVVDSVAFEAAAALP